MPARPPRHARACRLAATAAGLGLLGGALVAAPAQAGTTTQQAERRGFAEVRPSADATVAGDKPGAALGRTTNLQVRGSTSDVGRRSALLRFPIGDLDSAKPVTLRLTGRHTDDETSERVRVSDAGPSWAERSVRWPTRPTTGTTRSVRSVGGYGTSDYEFDVTAAVAAARAAGRAEVSLSVSAVGTGDALSTFASREAGASGPRLLARADRGERGVLVSARREPEAGANDYLAQRLRDIPGYQVASAAPATTKYGGDATRQRQQATGRFRVQKIDGRSWFVDPSGAPFYSKGVNSVRLPNAAAPGTTVSQAVDTVRSLGFNSTGAFSDEAVADAAARTPYTADLRLMQTFGRELDLTSAGEGHVDYRSDSIPVFHPGFADSARRSVAERAASTKDDPFLLGYFLDNELPVTDNGLRKILAVPTSDPALGPNAAEAQRFLLDRRGAGATAAQVTQDDEDAWLAHVMDRYYQLTTEAVQANAPGQLVLGSRLHARALKLPGVIAAAGRYVDVVSLNHYGRWEPRAPEQQMWAEQSPEAPVLLSEMYVKGADTGGTLAGGAGWVVPTQADRGLWYQNAGIRALSAQNVVGWHYFKYQDGAGESNKGLLAEDGSAYGPITTAVSEMNRNVYPLIKHLDGQR